jgi:AraC-like DNA-binding protein
MNDPAQTLYDPRDGDAALTVTALDVAPGAGRWVRSNCFTVLHVRTGAGSFWADDARHAFTAPCLLFFSPYQQLRLDPASPASGSCVRFHANFLCIETHHHEVGCDGVLFNDPYGVPAVALDAAADAEAADLIGQMRREMGEAGLAHSEVLVSYLKILLVRAARLKRLQQGAGTEPLAGRRPAILDELRDLLEANYRELHSPADYAELLHATPKALGRVVKEHLGKTLTALIRERVLKHAKWELLHTLRPVKEIAREVGFDDELYFSRMFKKATGRSPTEFREYETAVRGGRNLSMPSAGASILPSAAEGQNANTPASDPR